MVDFEDDPGPRPIARIFDVDRLGVATYVLALGYIIFAVSASFKLARVNKFLTHWNSQKYFHVFVVVHLVVRALTFGTLCFLSIVDVTPWYPLLVMLFTLPEFFILSTYCLLFFHWLEIYVFSHEQFMIASKNQFRKNWKLSFLVITMLLYVTLVTFYMILSAKPEEFEDYVVQTICYIAAAGCLGLPVLMSMVACYFGVFVLAGFPFSSAIARERVSKINTVMVIWTFGRITRGVIFILSIQHQWQNYLNEVYLSIVTISVLAVSEIFPFMLSLDWSMIGVLLLGEEAQKLRTEREQSDTYRVLTTTTAHHGTALLGEPLRTGVSDAGDALLTGSVAVAVGVGPGPSGNGNGRYLSHGGGVGDNQKWDIDPREIKFGADIKEESGISFSQRGTWNGRAVSMRAFRFQEMNSSMIEELIGDLIDGSTVDHEHIAHFLGVARIDATVYQITEYVTRGSLYTVIQHSKKNFNGLTILRLAREMAAAMQHLHSVGQVHGHLKSSCVLLDDNMSVKVGDIGIRRLIAYAEVILVERSATAWSAPEILDGHVTTKASDVYSFGVVCWELVSRQVPYEQYKTSFSDMRTAVLRRNEKLVLPAHTDLPQAFNHLIEKCMDSRPSQRPSFQQICKALADITI